MITHTRYILGGTSINSFCWELSTLICHAMLMFCKSAFECRSIILINNLFLKKKKSAKCFTASNAPKRLMYCTWVIPVPVYEGWTKHSQLKQKLTQECWRWKANPWLASMFTNNMDILLGMVIFLYVPKIAICYHHECCIQIGGNILHTLIFLFFFILLCPLYQRFA